MVMDGSGGEQAQMLIQCVPLATEPGTEDIATKLNRSTFVV